jgi:hypothetical protein
VLPPVSAGSWSSFLPIFLAALVSLRGAGTGVNMAGEELGGQLIDRQPFQVDQDVVTR